MLPYNYFDSNHVISQGKFELLSILLTIAPFAPVKPLGPGFPGAPYHNRIKRAMVSILTNQMSFAKVVLFNTLLYSTSVVRCLLAATS